MMRILFFLGIYLLLSLLSGTKSMFNNGFGGLEEMVIRNESPKQTPEQDQIEQRLNPQRKRQKLGGEINGSVAPSNMSQAEQTCNWQNFEKGFNTFADNHNTLGAQLSGKQHLQQQDVGIANKSKAYVFEVQQEPDIWAEQLGHQQGGDITAGTTVGYNQFPYNTENLHYGTRDT